VKPEITFDQMPDHARLWVFAADHALESPAAVQLLERVDHFIAGWNAHGQPVVGSRDLTHRRFLLVAADEKATGVSGCSIDSLFRVLKAAEQEMGLNLLDSSLVHYRDPHGEIRSVSRAEFREAVQAGEVGPGTHVFDNTVDTVGALREGKWERPMAESWHARAFGVPHDVSP
jgi:hypothetical protein